MLCVRATVRSGHNCLKFAPKFVSCNIAVSIGSAVSIPVYSSVNAKILFASLITSTFSCSQTNISSPDSVELRVEGNKINWSPLPFVDIKIASPGKLPTFLQRLFPE